MQICVEHDLVPEACRDCVFQRIIRPFRDCFRIDGASAPEIKGFKAWIIFNFGQQYKFSRFDEARLKRKSWKGN